MAEKAKAAAIKTACLHCHCSEKLHIGLHFQNSHLAIATKTDFERAEKPTLVTTVNQHHDVQTHTHLSFLHLSSHYSRANQG